MKSSRVALLDLRLAPADSPVLQHRPFLHALLCAGTGGLLVGFLWVLRMEHDQQQLRQAQSDLRAELAALQAEQRARDTRMKALQEHLAQWQQHRQQQDRWHWLGHTLQTLGRSDEPSGRLMQLRWDAQGLTLSGEIAPSRLQPWLQRWTTQTPGLGPWRAVEIGRGTGEEALEGPALEASTRFVIRFGTVAPSPDAAP